MGFFLRLFVYGSILSGFGIAILNFLQHMDLKKVVHDHQPGACSVIKGIEHGAEDLDILPNGIAILSTGLRFNRKYQNLQSWKGKLMYYNISSAEESAKEFKISGFTGELNPHGLSLYLEGGMQRVFVYVVNHPPFNEHPPADVVLKFLWEVDKGQLVYQKTFSDPEFVGINDLVVVGKDQFYITNYQAMRSKLLQELEMMLTFIPLQNVLYFDGTKASVVLTGMYGPNGIDVSPDKKFLYVAECTKRSIASYRINSPQDLFIEDSLYLGTMPDNINVNPRTADLWIGTHPVYHKIAQKLFLDLSAKSPSQILRISAKDGKFTKSTEIYSNDGGTLSASTVAAFHKGKNVVLMGTINHRALMCQCDSCI